VSDPVIEITPTPAQYRELCRDLEALRTAGASSNTIAIVEAVRVAAEAARASRVLGDEKRPRGAGTPGGRSQGGKP
jgi:hypothetical protein